MTKVNKIIVKNIKISLYQKDTKDFISLTDISKYKNGLMSGLIISHWLRMTDTLNFLGLWEQLYNPHFNVTEFGNIKNESGSNSFVISSKQWISKTNAIGIISKPGRYGGTYAHKDIAFEFASWISPEFKLFLIKEFQRLKEKEITQNNLDWDLKRNLAAINYHIHTDAIKENLIPPSISIQEANLTYAKEADVLNKALFGMTAKQWRSFNQNKKGNLRDYANIHQLVCLSNLEVINAQLIDEKIPQRERLLKLNKIAIKQMRILLGLKKVQKLPHHLPIQTRR